MWREIPRFDLEQYIGRLKEISLAVENLPYLEGNLGFASKIEGIQGNALAVELSPAPVLYVMPTKSEIACPLLVHQDGFDDEYAPEGYSETETEIFYFDPKTNQQIIVATHKTKTGSSNELSVKTKDLLFLKAETYKKFSYYLRPVNINWEPKTA